MGGLEIRLLITKGGCRKRPTSKISRYEHPGAELPPRLDT
jgi:hypothetical protein